MNKKIYLVSASPRRKELLELTGLDFEVTQLEALDENGLLQKYKGDIEDRAKFLAMDKALYALGRGIDGTVITADTLVISDDGAMLGKPSGEREAEMFLDRLAGNWHTVATGVAIGNVGSKSPEGKILSTLVTTRVKFSEMSPGEIKKYIETGEPFDKAGGYGIQGRASVYIEKIEGCYFNVVGFPLNAFWKLWKKFLSE